MNWMRSFCPVLPPLARVCRFCRTSGFDDCSRLLGIPTCSYVGIPVRTCTNLLIERDLACTEWEYEYESFVDLGTTCFACIAVE
jgi:hypothetical protein